MRKLMSIVVALVLCLFSMSSSLTVGAVDVKMPTPVTHDAWFTNAITSNNELLLFSCRSTIYENGSLSIMVSPFVNNPKSKAFSLTFTEPTCVRYTDTSYLFLQKETYSFDN